MVGRSSASIEVRSVGQGAAQSAAQDAAQGTAQDAGHLPGCELAGSLGLVESAKPYEERSNLRLRQAE